MTMNQDDLDLFHGYLNGTIQEVDFAKLQSLLRESAEARRTLRALATVDAKLQSLGALNAKTAELLVMPPASLSPARSSDNYLGWGSFAAAVAVAALVLGWMLFATLKPSRLQLDVAAAISPTQHAIARFSFESPSSIPAWASPTASLLDQPRFPQ